MHNLHNFSFSAIPFAIGAIGGCSCIRGGLCNRLNKIEFNAFIDILLCEHLRMCRGVFRTFTILCWNNAVQYTTETNCIKLYPDIWWQQCWGSKYELKHKSKDKSKYKSKHKSKDKSKYKYCDNSDVESVGVTWCRLAFDSLHFKRSRSHLCVFFISLFFWCCPLHFKWTNSTLYCTYIYRWFNLGNFFFLSF